MIDTLDMINLGLGFMSGASAMFLATLNRIHARNNPNAPTAPCASGVARPAPVMAVAAGAVPVSAPFEPAMLLASESAESDGATAALVPLAGSARDRVLQEPALVGPHKHALALIEWVRDAGLPDMTAQQLEDVYGEMCLERFWAVHRWQTIAAHLHKLTGEKPYGYVNGVRKRIYRLQNVQLPGAAGHAATQEPETTLPMAA